MKFINAALKVVACLIMLSPVTGILGIFPPPTREMYNTPEAFAFIEMLMDVGYVNWIMAIVFATSIVLIATKRTAFAALLMLPITVNIFAFHLFLDGGILTPGAILGNILFALNLYFLWQNRDRYKTLTDRE